MTILHQFINLLFPNNCVGCEEALLFSEKILCTNCLLDMPKTNIGFSNSQQLMDRFRGVAEIKAVFSFYKYSKGGKVQSLIHNLKYKNRKDIGLFMGKLFGKQILQEQNKLKIDVLLAVPLHQKKLMKRGFNQSDLIASGLSEVLNISHEANMLFRITSTETQTKKTRINRYLNVEDVFETRNFDRFIGKSIGLVDDVLTTGATLEVCANTLLKAGAKDVTIFALASAI